MQSANEVKVGTSGLASITANTLEVTPQEEVIRVLKKVSSFKNQIFKSFIFGDQTQTIQKTDMSFMLSLGSAGLPVWKLRMLGDVNLIKNMVSIVYYGNVFFCKILQMVATCQ